MISEKLKAVVDSALFRNFITAVIVLAGILVGVETYPQIMQRYGNVVYMLDSIVLAIFVVEILVRIGSYGLKPFRFFLDPWNLFDFIIVFVCLLPFEAQFVAVLRLARVLRVLRLVTALPSLQLLVGALLKSIPSIGYISVLLILHFYIYACIGTFIFGENDPLHFGTLHDSMLSLFQVVTLEGWIDIMYIQMFGSDNWEFGGRVINAVQSVGRPIAAPLYFISFILFGTMIILNLFIGVIMSGMAEMQAEHDAKELEDKRQKDRLRFSDEIQLLITDIDQMKNQLQLIQRRMKVKEG